MHFCALFYCLVSGFPLTASAQALQSPEQDATPATQAPSQPYASTFKLKPSLSAEELQSLAQFSRSLNFPSEAGTQAILQKSRAVLAQFQQDTALHRKDLGHVTWNIERPFHADTPRPHIPQLELMGRIALLQSAFHFSRQDWESAWQGLLDLHVAARVLNADPNLFAQLGSQTLEAQALRLGARYLHLSPSPSYEKFKKDRLALAPLDGGLAALRHQYQIHVFQVGEVLGMPGVVKDAPALVQLLKSFQANADPKDPQHLALKSQLESMIQHMEHLEKMYRDLEALWTRPYPEAIAEITRVYQAALKDAQIHYSSTFPYAPFYRKCQELKTYEALLQAGERLLQRSDPTDLQDLPLDPRFQLPFEVATQRDSKPASLTLRSPGSKNEVLHLIFLLEAP